MNVHKNARLTPRGRELMIDRIENQGWRVDDAARSMGVSERTAYRWLARHRSGAGFDDRSSAPRRCPHELEPSTIAAIERLRRQRLTGPAIAAALDLARSTVGAVLRRIGLGRLSRLDAPPPAQRYERERPGELIHVDIKKLGRIVGIGHRITGIRADVPRVRGSGWECLHVAIDDASRLAYTEMLADEKQETVCGFMARALAWYERHGIIVERVMTDNGSAYRSRQFARLLAASGLRHLRTRPYTPRTNGKAERFIQTSLREWAYAVPYESSAQRAAAMPIWIDAYNCKRPHSALKGIPPFQRLNNLLGFDS